MGGKVNERAGNAGVGVAEPFRVGVTPPGVGVLPHQPVLHRIDGEIRLGGSIIVVGHRSLPFGRVVH